MKFSLREKNSWNLNSNYKSLPVERTEVKEVVPHFPTIPEQKNIILFCSNLINFQNAQRTEKVLYILVYELFLLNI